MCNHLDDKPIEIWQSELEELKQDLTFYKKALEVACNIIENHAYCPYMCDGNRTCIDCLLQKAREDDYNEEPDN